MKTILNHSEIKQEISKSQFLAYSFYVETITQAESYLLELKKQHSKATHICYAVLTINAEKCSDDGEPSSTAGMPILNVIKKGDYVNVLVAVVRYYGGVKLGAGGLVRAYGNAAKEVLQNSGSANLVVCKQVEVVMPYETYNTQFLPALKQHDVWVLKTEFLNEVNLTLRVKENDNMLRLLEVFGVVKISPESYLERK